MEQIKNHKERKSRISKARATLYTANSSEILLKIMTMKSTFEVWNFLKDSMKKMKGLKERKC
ncbi:hypothetical protein J1N35_001748 [Gossypium stocksii]|uniref:Uncharacterized protein n=1 Tax=Gossypium stocksii TaxID=47602 RepID=A0A9D3WKH0_9ROSI|nr:hypothetical protein J1N35_001748 [Gossypium stocksii]